MKYLHLPAKTNLGRHALECIMNLQNLQSRLKDQHFERPNKVPQKGSPYFTKFDTKTRVIDNQCK